MELDAKLKKQKDKLNHLQKKNLMLEKLEITSLIGLHPNQRLILGTST